MVNSSLFNSLGSNTPNSTGVAPNLQDNNTPPPAYDNDYGQFTVPPTTPPAPEASHPTTSALLSAYLPQTDTVLQPEAPLSSPASAPSSALSSMLPPQTPNYAPDYAGDYTFPPSPALKPIKPTVPAGTFSSLAEMAGQNMTIPLPEGEQLTEKFDYSEFMANSPAAPVENQPAQDISTPEPSLDAVVDTNLPIDLSQGVPASEPVEQAAVATPAEAPVEEPTPPANETVNTQKNEVSQPLSNSLFASEDSANDTSAPKTPALIHSKGSKAANFIKLTLKIIVSLVIIAILAFMVLTVLPNFIPGFVRPDFWYSVQRVLPFLS